VEDYEEEEEEEEEAFIPKNQRKKKATQKQTKKKEVATTKTTKKATTAKKSDHASKHIEEVKTFSPTVSPAKRKLGTIEVTERSCKRIKAGESLNCSNVTSYYSLLTLVSHSHRGSA